MRRWLADRRGDMAEGALTFPLMILVTLALVNLCLAGLSPRQTQVACARQTGFASSGPGCCSAWHMNVPPAFTLDCQVSPMSLPPRI